MFQKSLLVSLYFFLLLVFSTWRVNIAYFFVSFLLTFFLLDCCCFVISRCFLLVCSFHLLLAWSSMVALFSLSPSSSSFWFVSYLPSFPVLLSFYPPPPSLPAHPNLTQKSAALPPSLPPSLRHQLLRHMPKSLHLPLPPSLPPPLLPLGRGEHSGGNAHGHQLLKQQLAGIGHEDLRNPILLLTRQAHEIPRPQISLGDQPAHITDMHSIGVRVQKQPIPNKCRRPMRNQTIPFHLPHPQPAIPPPPFQRLPGQHRYRAPRS